MINNSRDIILPPVQYLQQDIQFQIFDECHIDDIAKWVTLHISFPFDTRFFKIAIKYDFSGQELVKNFHKLSLPLNTLSLLNSSTGIFVLMMSPRSVQEHFFRNLYYLLEES